MSLKDCEEFLNYKDIDIPRHQVVKYYMFFGSIPYYNNKFLLSNKYNELLDNKKEASSTFVGNRS